MRPVEGLLDQVDALIVDVEREAGVQAANWAPWIENDFADSAANLAAYLALRHRDLRPLQRSLMALGLSSLGRLESRVRPTLAAVRASLAGIAGEAAGERPSEAAFFAGERRLAERARALLGLSGSGRSVALMVTCPSEAADDPDFMLDLVRHEVEAIRINCASDDAARWQRMVEHARAAERVTGRGLRVFMDLAGPKIRTGEVRVPGGDGRIRRGDTLVIVPTGGLGADRPDGGHAAAECTLAEAVATARPGDRVFYDDGKFGAKVTRAEPWGLIAEITICADKGARLRPGKGLNFPDTELRVDALTDQDREDLDFVAANADAIGFSFVQSADDVAALQDALAERRRDWTALALVLKIETTRAVANVPDMLVRAAGRQPAAIMIARGDLAVEVGFARTAEMQEELLWVGEAAQVPVIWATQVLEHLVKKGTPSRGEMTDAAMAARAECVMLNKGPHLLDAITTLGSLIGRMDEHQHKKTPQLRRLRSW